MSSTAPTNEEIIQLTRRCIHSFYERNLDDSMKNMSSDFMWIGAFSFQYIQGLSEFLRVTALESQEEPIEVHDEEYQILFHDAHVWTVVGYYEATAYVRDQNVILHAQVRITAVWRMINNELKLCHLHGSNAQDVPLVQTAPADALIDDDRAFFDAVHNLDVPTPEITKITLRDRNKNYHFINPENILYLEAARQYSRFYTSGESFEVRGGLLDFDKKFPEKFIRIHKSYLVSTHHIANIHRFAVVLKNGKELPVGKERYATVKAQLAGERDN